MSLVRESRHTLRALIGRLIGPAAGLVVGIAVDVLTARMSTATEPGDGVPVVLAIVAFGTVVGETFRLKRHCDPDPRGWARWIPTAGLPLGVAFLGALVVPAVFPIGAGARYALVGAIGVSSAIVAGATLCRLGPDHGRGECRVVRHGRRLLEVVPLVPTVLVVGPALAFATEPGPIVLAIIALVGCLLLTLRSIARAARARI